MLHVTCETHPTYILFQYESSSWMDKDIINLQTSLWVQLVRKSCKQFHTDCTWRKRKGNVRQKPMPWQKGKTLFCSTEQHLTSYWKGILLEKTKLPLFKKATCCMASHLCFSVWVELMVHRWAEMKKTIAFQVQHKQLNMRYESVLQSNNLIPAERKHGPCNMHAYCTHWSMQLYEEETSGVSSFW